jgi:hypothetical protein
MSGGRRPPQYGPVVDALLRGPRGEAPGSTPIGRKSPASTVPVPPGSGGAPLFRRQLAARLAGGAEGA